MTRLEHHLTRPGKGTLTLIVLLCLVFTTGFGPHHPAPPVERPFHGTYEGTVSMPAGNPILLDVSFTVTGTATHLGKFQMANRAAFINLTSFSSEGNTTITAANGDELFTHYSSWGMPQGNDSYKIEGFHEILGGTGRFAGASGSFNTLSFATMQETPETVTISGKVDMNGTILY